MKNFINAYFAKIKKNKEIANNAPKDITYLSLLNYIFSLGKQLTPANLSNYLNSKTVSAAIDQTTKNRLIAFHYSFIEQWQEAYNHALPLATTLPYDQDMVGLIASLWNNSGKYKNAFEFIEKYSDEKKIENKESFFAMRGTTAWCAGETKQALLYLHKTLELSPENREANSSLAAIYAELGDQGKSREYRIKLLNLYPSHPDILFFEGIYKITDGDYEAGYPLYEKRYASSLATKYFREGALQRERWDGTALSGKKLYLCFEQGLGDTLMTCRFIPELKKLGANIIAECQPEAKDLLQSNFPEASFFCTPPKQAFDLDFDVWIGSMSLPYLLKIDNLSPPHRDGYLVASPTLQEESPIPNASSKIKIGISWSGNPAHTNDARRSIPWDIAKDVIERSSFEFYAIQTFIPEQRPANLIDISDQLITLTDTAEIISKLDLIITVDTSLVHLSGAMSKKTWLLCHSCPEWRWGCNEGETRWYKSVKIFKQTKLGDWKELLERVILNELPSFIKDMK